LAQHTIAVLGCGVAGLAAARRLRRQLPEDRILVIDRVPFSSYSPSYTALAVGEVRAPSIKRPRERLARTGIEFVNAPIQNIDAEGHQVRAESRVIRYDQLVVALGSEPAPERVPGLAETAQFFHSLETSERLAASLRYFGGGKVLIALAPGTTRWPPSAYELSMLLEHYFHNKKMRQKVEIAIVAPEPAPLTALGQQASELVAGQLAHKGIEFVSGRALASVDHGRRLAAFDDGSERSFDLLLALPQVKAPPVAMELGIVDESGWISVESGTMRTSREDIFAVGDAARIQGAAGLMTSGILAASEARVATDEICRSLGAQVQTVRLDGRGRLFVEVGAGVAFMVSGDLTGPPATLRVTQPSIVWHWAKALLEKRWRYEGW
jgi:sulfide:quinone oxidoreductase